MGASWWNVGLDSVGETLYSQEMVLWVEWPCWGAPCTRVGHSYLSEGFCVPMWHVTLLRGPVYPRGTITLLRVSCVSTWDTVTLLRVSCVSMWDTVTLLSVSCVFTWETVTLLRSSVCLHGTFILLRGSVCPHGRQLPCRRGSPYAHMPQFNCDTVASSAWLNLGKEPFPEAARRYLHWGSTSRRCYWRKKFQLQSSQ